MTIFALKKEDGAYYPIILLDGSQEVIDDDACGGYERRTDVIEEVRKYYGTDAECVSQQRFHDEFSRRRSQRMG